MCHELRKRFHLALVVPLLVACGSGIAARSEPTVSALPRSQTKDAGDPAALRAHAPTSAPEPVANPELLPEETRNRIIALVAAGDRHDTFLLIQLIDAEILLGRERAVGGPAVSQRQRRVDHLAAALDRTTSPRVDLPRFLAFIARRMHAADRGAPIIGRRQRLVEKGHGGAARDDESRSLPAESTGRASGDLWQRVLREFPAFSASETPAFSLISIAKADAERAQHSERGPNDQERVKYDGWRKHAEDQLAAWKDVDCEAVRRELDEEVSYLEGFRDAARNVERRDSTAIDTMLDQLAIKLASLDRHVRCRRDRSRP